MRIIFLSLLQAVLVFGQSVFFNEPKISGTPLTPSDEYVQNYFKELQQTDPLSFQKLTTLHGGVYAVGEERDFNVLNLTDPDNPKFDKKTFVLKKEGALINIWVEKAELNNNHVTDAVINSIYNGLVERTPFGSYNPNLGIYEIDVEVFGSPPDIDGNGEVDFLLTDVQDGWDGSGGYIGGFFFQTDQTTNPGSNRADIMYVDTYPGIYRESNGTVSYQTSSVLGTVSHEFQHLIQYKNDRFEQNWINEGLSEFSSFLCGYGLRSPDLFLKNAELNLTSWDEDNSLPHYSRVALWMYFLYEKYGLELIKQLARNPAPGVSGLNAALENAAISKTMNDVTAEFFKTMVSNEPQLNAQFAFDLPALQYIRTIPNYRISKYDFEIEIPVQPYSVQSVEFINGDSLVVNFNNEFNNVVYVNRTGGSAESYLEQYSGSIFNDLGFGLSHHTTTLHFINNNAQSQTVSFTPAALPKYDLITLEYGGDEPDLLISPSKGFVNAIQYISPRDNAFVKSVEFYNSNYQGAIKAHVYENKLTDGSNPASVSITKNNVVNSEWVRIDLEDIKVPVSRNQLFNVGIEYLDDGAMGYEDVSGSSHKNRSFRKQPGSLFATLSDYWLDPNDPGTALDGAWMVRLEIAAPFTGVNNNNGTETISNVRFKSLPYDASAGKFLIISYKYEGSSDVKLQIYNILGQLIYQKSNNSVLNSFAWDGNTLSGRKAVPGMYIISLGPKNKKIFQKIILMR